MLENHDSSHFLSSKQPCGPRSLDFALNTAVVDKIRWENLRLRSTGGHSIRGLSERSISDGGNLCPLWLNRRHLKAAIQLAVSCSELYFSRCCALKRTGTLVSERKVYVLIVTDFKK